MPKPWSWPKSISTAALPAPSYRRRCFYPRYFQSIDPAVHLLTGATPFAHRRQTIQHYPSRNQTAVRRRMASNHPMRHRQDYSPRLRRRWPRLEGRAADLDAGCNEVLTFCDRGILLNAKITRPECGTDGIPLHETLHARVDVHSSVARSVDHGRLRRLWLGESRPDTSGKLLAWRLGWRPVHGLFCCNLKAPS